MISQIEKTGVVVPNGPEFSSYDPSSDEGQILYEAARGLIWAAYGQAGQPRPDISATHEIRRRNLGSFIADQQTEQAVRIAAGETPSRADQQGLEELWQLRRSYAENEKDDSWITEEVTVRRREPGPLAPGLDVRIVRNHGELGQTVSRISCSRNGRPRNATPEVGITVWGTLEPWLGSVDETGRASNNDKERRDAFALYYELFDGGTLSAMRGTFKTFSFRPTKPGLPEALEDQLVKYEMLVGGVLPRNGVAYHEDQMFKHKIDRPFPGAMSAAAVVLRGLAENLTGQDGGASPVDPKSGPRVVQSAGSIARVAPPAVYA